jgi:hypothetical protein
MTLVYANSAVNQDNSKNVPVTLTYTLTPFSEAPVVVAPSATITFTAANYGGTPQYMKVVLAGQPAGAELSVTTLSAPGESATSADVVGEDGTLTTSVYLPGTPWATYLYTVKLGGVILGDFQS